jgi:DNA primase
MSIDILSILDKYSLISSTTETSGNYVRISCPFHNEAIASFSIRLDNGVFHCFGCGMRGTIKTLVAKLEKCNELQALMIIKRFKDTSFKQPIVKTNSDLLYGAKLQYEVISKPNWRQEHCNYMIKERNFIPKTLNEFGVKIDECSRFYPILIPILDNGIFKGTLRRRIDNSDRRKYMNNKGFSRKRVLGGMYEDGWILVVEGYLDMMKAWQLGYKNVACLFHWKASPNQIQKLKHFSNKIISGLDNTPLGEEGTKLLQKYFKVKRFKYAEECKDIGDYKTKFKFRKSIYETLEGGHNNGN